MDHGPVHTGPWYGLTNELLGNIKIFCFFPVTFVNVNYLAVSVLSFRKRLHLFAVNLIHNRLTALLHLTLLLASELCGFEPVSQKLVRNLICHSAPKSCVLDPIPTTLLKMYLDDSVPLISRIVKQTLLFGSNGSSAVQGGIRDPPSPSAPPPPPPPKKEPLMQTVFFF